MRRWWVQKYKLPPQHALFQNQSLAELLQEMYEDMYAEKEELEARLAEGGLTGDLRQDALSQLSRLSRALGEEDETRDDLVDEWERALAEGRTPDLDAMP